MLRRGGRLLLSSLDKHGHRNVAEAYGHVGIRVDTPEEVEPALRKAFIEHKDDLVFLDIRTERETNVYPMVAAGKGLSEIIMAEPL